MSLQHSPIRFLISWNRAIPDASLNLTTVVPLPLPSHGSPSRYLEQPLPAAVAFFAGRVAVPPQRARPRQQFSQPNQRVKSTHSSRNVTRGRGRDPSAWVPTLAALSIDCDWTLDA